MSRYSKQEVNYTADSRYSNEKCKRCRNVDHGSDRCKILDGKDNYVVPDGWCNKFEDGKHLIIDLDKLEMEMNQKRLEWRVKEAKRKERLRKTDRRVT